MQSIDLYRLISHISKTSARISHVEKRCRACNLFIPLIPFFFLYIVLLCFFTFPRAVHLIRIVCCACCCCRYDCGIISMQDSYTHILSGFDAKILFFFNSKQARWFLLRSLGMLGSFFCIPQYI